MMAMAVHVDVISPSSFKFCYIFILICLLLKRVLPMTEKTHQHWRGKNGSDYEQRALRRSLITITDPRPQHLRATQPYQLDQTLQLVVRQTALGAEGRELLQAKVWSQENKMGQNGTQRIRDCCAHMSDVKMLWLHHNIPHYALALDRWTVSRADRVEESSTSVQTQSKWIKWNWKLCHHIFCCCCLHSLCDIN